MRMLWKFQRLGVQCLNSLVGRGRKAHGCLSGISSFPHGQLHSEGSRCQSRKLKCMCVFGERGSTVRLKYGLKKKKSPGASLTLHPQALSSSSSPSPPTPHPESTVDITFLLQSVLSFQTQTLSSTFKGHTYMQRHRSALLPPPWLLDFQVVKISIRNSFSVALFLLLQLSFPLSSESSWE